MKKAEPSPAPKSGTRKRADETPRAQKFQPTPPPLSAKLISQLQGAVKAARNKRLTEE